jgi:predicted nucleotide-binding protein (sugar kinase/HSP70/actin superfamily)
LDSSVYIGYLNDYFRIVKGVNQMKELIRKGEKVPAMFTPRMEYYFDEITEQMAFKCPVTGKEVNVEVVKRAHIGPTPFVDVVYCSIFKGYPNCKKACLGLVNREKTLHELSQDNKKIRRAKSHLH